MSEANLVHPVELPADIRQAVAEQTALLAEAPPPVTFRLGNRYHADLGPNVLDCATRELPMIGQATVAAGPALIVGKGPSLSDPATWGQVVETARTATVFAVKDNADWLRDRGLQPRYVLNADQAPELTDRIPADPSLTYLVASCCHPSLFDKLLDAGCDVRVWHFACGARWMGVPEATLYRSLFAESWVAESGSTIVNRAVPLAIRMGHLPITVAGADFGARSINDGYYAVGMPGRLTGEAFIMHDGGRIDGRVWHTRPDLIVAARSMAHLVRGGWVTVLGDSLANALASNPLAELNGMAA